MPAACSSSTPVRPWVEYGVPSAASANAWAGLLLVEDASETKDADEDEKVCSGLLIVRLISLDGQTFDTDPLASSESTLLSTSTLTPEKTAESNVFRMVPPWLSSSDVSSVSEEFCFC